ncbi:hypothetical protein B0A55_09395 [Friedmanniomyces simplex]|uniref:Uncharacterized protein n=1 Tax=Friedmanniomyces simplex TaxID=329884 RepID=A0A4U0WSM4_9PEZI|nr:hypothetical protein B0A55_09395 [Friedmanniomyces simplex]
MKYVGARSIRIVERVSKKLKKDPMAMKEFLMKVSSIEHDFTQYYDEAKSKANNDNGAGCDGVVKSLDFDGVQAEVALHAEAG